MVERLPRFLEELRRRKVIRAAAVYLAAAFVVIQVADSLFPLLRLPEWTGSLAAGLLILGFPIVLALAWVFELTPEGLERERPSPARNRTEGERRRQPVPPSDPSSIAVLPFANLSSDPENEYFSDGVTHDVIAAIARVPGLRVLCRTSIMPYKGVHRSVREIGRELGVATVVIGSVQRSGSRVRVTAGMVDAHADRQLWSETYDRGLEDIFGVQSEVASSVAVAVRCELTDSARDQILSAGTRDVEGYELYLRARFLWEQRTEPALAQALDLYRRAIQHDPEFALAHAGVADALTILGIYGARPPADVMERARKAADRALDLVPALGEALAVRGCVRAVFDWDWSRAEDDFRQAIKASPSYSTAHQWYALNLLTPQARFGEAVEGLERAARLDPLSPAIAVSRGILSFYARSMERANDELEAVRKQHPGLGLAYSFLGQCRSAMGRHDDAVSLMATAVHLSGESSETLAAHGSGLAAAGRADEAGAILHRLEARSRQQYVSPALLAQVRMGLGDAEGALSELERAADLRASDLVWLGVRPVYDPLRGEARFQSLLERVGLPSAVTADLHREGPSSRAS